MQSPGLQQYVKNTNRQVECDNEIHVEYVHRTTDDGQTNGQQTDRPKTDDGQTISKMMTGRKKDMFLAEQIFFKTHHIPNQCRTYTLPQRPVGPQ